MKCVTNFVLFVVLGSICGCCSISENDLSELEYRPADLSDYDEGLVVYDVGFYKSEPGCVYPSLCGVAVLYPNLVALRITSEDEKEREIDFSWLRHMRKLSHVDVSGRWNISHLEEFCKNRDKENLTVRLSNGSWHSLDGEIRRKPEINAPEVELAKEDVGPGVEESQLRRGNDVPDARKEEYIAGDCEKCYLSFYEIRNPYREGDSLRWVDFGNDGDMAVAIRRFPQCCNAVGLLGAFELLESCKGEHIESMVVEGKGERVRDLLKAITPSRFPRLRYLKVYADSEDEIEVDISGLLNFPEMKVLMFKSKNVIPNGLARLHCLGEKAFLEFRVAIRRSR